MKKILIIDDEKDLANLLKEGLSFAGYEVVGCSLTGDDGLIKYRQSKPEIILLDLTLPDIDGFTLAQQIKSENPYDKPIIIIMTCHLSDEDKIKGKVCGIDDYITKPFSFNDVLSKVQSLTGK